jgi:hypothetical protein
MRYCERTKYKDLYDGSTWGGYEEAHFKLANNILENRNIFPIEYNIKRRCDNIPNHIFNMIYSNKELSIDHIEVYTTNDKKYILVSSPYTDSQTQLYEQSGWTLIYPIYGNDASTYIKIVNMKGT